MSYQLITTNEQLHQYCMLITKSKSFTLDSEFVRTKTFYPQLGLLQIFDGQHLALIDPINISDWHHLLDVLKRTDVEKYFHACSEDVEVFSYHFNTVPLPILDSQICAAFLDNPLSSGYASLVKKYLNIELDKSETRTDWLQRPLSDKQCQYAANDVAYLMPLMTQLKALIEEKGWLDAAYQECQNAVKRRCEVVKADNAYLNIKNAWQLRGYQLGHLQKLASWRLNYAKDHNIALNFVIHEEILWKLARYQPKSLAELSLLGVRGKEIRLFGELLLQLLSSPSESLAPIKRIVNYPDAKLWGNRIKDAASQIAIDTQLNVELLVTRRHIEQMVKWSHGELNDTVPELISGWRGELFKPYLNL